MAASALFRRGSSIAKFFNRKVKSELADRGGGETRQDATATLHGIGFSTQRGPVKCGVLECSAKRSFTSTGCRPAIGCGQGMLSARGCRRRWSGLSRLSGPKIFTSFTREEIIAICEGHVARLDAVDSHRRAKSHYYARGYCRRGMMRYASWRLIALW
jgi:hypothetical protein